MKKKSQQTYRKYKQNEILELKNTVTEIKIIRTKDINNDKRANPPRHNNPKCVCTKWHR